MKVMKKSNILLILFVIILPINSSTFDYFHCKAATCHEFYYGLRNYPNQKDYVDVCHETVRSLQNISFKYGKCFDEITRKLNPACIYALATTIKTCIYGLRSVPERYSRYYCGHRLMQNCAKHIGLDRFPYNSKYEQVDEK